MKNYCGKCGSKLNSETGLCPNCSKTLKIVKCENKNIKKEKKKSKGIIWMIGIFLVGSCIIGGLACFDVVNLPVISDFVKMQNEEDDYSEKEYIEIKELEQANQNCIVIVKKSIEMENEKEGTATITVSMPNYEQLYKEALQAENPDEYLLKALEEKEFSTVEYEEKVPVTVEKLETIIHSEEVVNQLLEEELIKAINALTREETVHEKNN